MNAHDDSIPKPPTNVQSKTKLSIMKKASPEMGRFIPFLILLIAAVACKQPSTTEKASTSPDSSMAGGVDRTIIPFGDPEFHGKVDSNRINSTPDFPKEIGAPPGAPNVLLILTDDVGYGASSTFGGPIQTPTFDRVAASGLRFNEFHTTSLCSPTRAALISGRNHHNVASGN